MTKNKFKLGIVGYGFVGQAIDYAFTHDSVEKFYVDPKLNTNIDELCKWDPACVFVCAPTPMSDNGTVDGAIVEDAVLKICLLYTSPSPRDGLLSRMPSSA